MLVVAFDASSLILLAKIDLLEKISENMDLVVTKQVEKEATVKETYDSKLIQKKIKNGKIRVESVEDRICEALAEDFNLDKGEASAMGLYKEGKYDLLVTDDGKSIDACKILDIKYTTALNILVRLVEKRKLDKDRGIAKLRRLEDYGWYKSKLIEEAEKSIRGE